MRARSRAQAIASSKLIVLPSRVAEFHASVPNRVRAGLKNAASSLASTAAEDGDLEALEELLAKDAVLYADSGGKAMAPPEPLFGAAEIARFMAAVAQPRPDSGQFETRVVRVNGQPGRLLRGPAERQPGEAERLATERALALLRSGDIDAKQLATLVKDARGAAAGRTARAAPHQQAEIRVWSVLTVDVVEGRIQAVRIVRNPDKLGHL